LATRTASYPQQQTQWLAKPLSSRRTSTTNCPSTFSISTDIVDNKVKNTHWFRHASCVGFWLIVARFPSTAETFDGLCDDEDTGTGLCGRHRRGTVVTQAMIALASEYGGLPPMSGMVTHSHTVKRSRLTTASANVIGALTGSIKFTVHGELTCAAHLTHTQLCTDVCRPLPYCKQHHLHSLLISIRSQLPGSTRVVLTFHSGTDERWNLCMCGFNIRRLDSSCTSAVPFMPS
jgi:hypothetical protein